MSYRKFKFISPGIFINEIDNSQLPAEPRAMGPAIIGRLEKGPALKPVQVNSFLDFVEIFGNPMPGGSGGDVFRHGNYTSPTYAAYAAQAWLRNNSPATMVRLLGQTYKDASAKTAYAGWSTSDDPEDSTNAANNNGAYGLFIAEGSGSSTIGTWDDLGDATDRNAALTGTLAAVWYLTNGSIQLSGSELVSGTTAQAGVESAFRWVEAASTGPTFKAVIKDTSGATVINSSFNFDSDSPRFIRKVFNTNPIRTNDDLMASGDDLNYWLGESFEGNLLSFEHSSSVGSNRGIRGTTPSNCWGIIQRLGTPDASTLDGGDFRMSEAKSPTKQFSKTGWFIAQDTSTTYETFDPHSKEKLFRFCSRELGEDTQRKIKISISNIRAADPLNADQYGTFTVLIRKISDTDASPVILEQYNNCNLDPASVNYIGRKIGNKFEEWDDTERRYRTYGDFANVSNYIYVQVHPNVERGSYSAKLIPFGVYGPPRYVGWATSGSGQISNYDYSAVYNGASGFIVSHSADPESNWDASGMLGSWFTGSDALLSDAVLNARYKFPALRLRQSSSEGPSLSSPGDAFFGVDTSYGNATGRLDYSVFDVIRTRAEDTDSWDATSGLTETSWIFTLDDVRNANVISASYGGSYGPAAVYQSGSRVLGTSYTAHTASAGLTKPDISGPFSGSYLNVIDDEYGGDTAVWNQFTTLLHGGADGVDITESDPFRNTLIDGKTQKNSAPYNSLTVAIDSLKDAEVVEYNLLTAPGLTNETLNTKMVETCEARGDALAIIDLQGGYKPPHESNANRVTRRGNVKTVVSRKRSNLQINSSYGCTYYPWVQIRDTISGVTLWAPPSIVALGAMSYGSANAQLWFAPAGFTRGGLSANKAAGIPVVGVEEKLTVKQRDKLYENQINPIASFPAEGIVIFGQKTLQISASALDRINVRRLLIFLKKQISKMAATVLFDQNVQVTWARFKSRVEPFLANVKAGLGVTEYKVVLDETTTTPDLIDRNIMYAKIFIKPARAIEYIAIDFIITNTGASFED